MRSLPLLLGLMVTGAALAGCADADEDADDLDFLPTGTPDVGARDLRTGLLAEDAVEGPPWELGRLWEMRITEGVDFSVSWSAVVAEDLGSQWLLAGTDPAVAAYHAVWDFSILGALDKRTLQTTEGGEPFVWYDWPLRDNHTWQAQRTVAQEDPEGGVSWEPASLTYTASYEPAVATPLGERPGYLIEATRDDGTVVERYDYTPAVGWFSEYVVYSQGVERYRIETLQASEGYEGTYYVSEAEEALLQWHDAHATSVEPYGSFQVAEEATYVLGYVFAYAAPGAAAAHLIDPDGQERVQHQFIGAGGGWEEFFGRAIPGEWRLVTVGAGAFAGGAGGHFWTVTHAEGRVGA